MVASRRSQNACYRINSPASASLRCVILKKVRLALGERRTRDLSLARFRSFDSRRGIDTTIRCVAFSTLTLLHLHREKTSDRLMEGVLEWSRLIPRPASRQIETQNRAAGS